MIETEEEIICVLEEIDSRFSSINRTLRGIRACVERMGEDSQNIARDVEPWIRFFSTSTASRDVDVCEQLEICSGVDGKESGHVGSETHMSPETMRFSSPRNPFVDNTSSEIVNRTFLGDLGKRFETGRMESSSSILMVVESGGVEEKNEDQESSDGVVLFDMEKIPPAFRNEKELVQIYDFVCRNPGVHVEDVYRELQTQSRDKTDIFIGLLVRKRFVGRRGGRLWASGNKAVGC